MKCSSTQVFDLNSFSCVDACNLTSSIQINDTQLSIFPICRSFDYYVDSTSESVVELGTKQYPFKSLGLVFVELLNYHANSNRAINVYLLENTDSYIDLGFNYIVNVSAVNFASYSLVSSTPSKATITVGETNDPTKSNITSYFNTGTRFNIIQNTELRKFQQIFSNSQLTSAEQNLLVSRTQVLIVHRSSITINNIVFKSIFNDVNSKYVLFLAIYLQDKVFSITNADFRTSGGLLNSYDPIVFNMNNIDVDFMNNIYGFDITPTCKYPEAYLYGGVNITNIKVYYSSGKRNVKETISHVIRYTGSGYYIINGYDSNISTKVTENCHSVNYLLQAVCVPMINTPHYMNFSNMHLSLNFSNPYMNLINIMVLQLYIETYRTHKITVYNFTAENVVNNIYPTVWIIGNPFVENTFNSVYAKSTKFCVANDVYFENSTASLQYLLAFTQTNNITVTNITFANVNGINTDAYSLLYLQTFSGGFITVDGFSILNSQIDKHKGIYVDTFGANTRAYFTLVNCVFRNITMKSGVKFIASAILKKLELSNITFSGMRQISLSDTTNILIELGGIDLNTTDIFDLSQISISNSSISLLHLSNIYNANLLGKSISLFNISYYDSLFQFQDNLIKIDGIETNNDFKITIKDITISGITFVRGGNLILFQQQTSTILTVSNTLFLNNNGGSIHFEAYNKNNPNLTTNMQFENMTIQNSNGYYQSLIKVTSGATISIYNSSFINNCNYVSGGVASVDSLGASLRLYNSTFMNNTSLKGGVFDVEDQGLLVINNCVLQNNFGVQSGVIQCSNEGYFQLYSSIITDNFAYSVSLSELFLSSTSSEINNSTIQNNLCLTKSYITQQLNNCSNLCFFKSDFKLFLSQNNNLMDITSVPYAFELISSSLSLSNSTSIENQDYLSGCFQSNFTISDSIIKSTSIQSNLIYLSSTSLTINNVAISNITRVNIDSFVIFALLESLITVTSVEYKNYSCGFLNAYSVQFSFKNFTMISGLLNNYLISLVSCTYVSISNSNIESLESSVSSIIYSSRSSIDLIQNISLSNLNTVGFEILSSNITQISQLFISDTAKGMILKDSNVLNMNNAEFISCGSQNVLFGGAIDIIDSSVTIQNSTFSNNNAQNGGAISIRCISFDNCENRMSILKFKSNQAGIKGGAIYYNFRRPEFDHIYYNNSIAPYGPNIASYSVKIVEQISNNSSMTFRNVPSGIKYDSIINLILQDYDNQTIPDSSYQIKISPITNGASVSGYDSARAIQGNAVFNNLVFILSPGNKNVQFKATSNAINYQINNAIGIPSYSSIDVSFRFCMPGESQISKTSCQTCAPGTYSLDWNSTSCNDCVTDATCSGGSKIEVNPGSWRISSNSTTILNCPYLSSCLGGYIPENEHPVSCEVGYSSYLCAECDIIDGNKYQKVSGGKCTKCSNPTINALKFIGVVLAAFIFLIIMIILILRKKRENQMSILIRILTNYLQLISLSLSFGLKFPDYLTQSFSAFDTIGSSSDTFLSYDCFFTSIQITGFTPSVSLFKILLTGLLPLMLFMVLGIIWIILYFALYKWFSNLKLNCIVSIICIIFLLHPTITKYSLEVFECIVVDANDKRMKLYMDYKCYSADHFKWISFVALPILICWVIGAPSIAFVVLYKYRKNLEGPIKSYMLMLYQGYRPKVFYWEFVNTFRKVLILCCSIFLSTETAIYRILLSILVLIIILRIQLKLKPYKVEENNNLEQNMITAGAMTLFCGVIFTNNSNNMFTMFALIIMLISNIYFLVLWLFYFLLSLHLKNKYMKSLIEIYSVVIFKKRIFENYTTTEVNSTSIPTQKPRKIKKNKHKKLFKGKVKLGRNKKKNVKKTKEKDEVFGKEAFDIDMGAWSSSMSSKNFGEQESNNRMLIESQKFKVKQSQSSELTSILAQFRSKSIHKPNRPSSQSIVYELEEESKEPSSQIQSLSLFHSP